MRTVVLGEAPPPLAEWLQRRHELGQDRHDEVWEGEYHVAPEAHGRHGDVQAQLAEAIGGRARTRGLWPSGPVNIGRPDDYRVPDLALFSDRRKAVFLPTAAVVVEVVSPGDESYAKFDFYFAAGVDEVLIVDPQRHAVQWYTRGASRFEPADGSAQLEISTDELAARLDWPQ